MKSLISKQAFPSEEDYNMSKQYDFKKVFELLNQMEECVKTVTQLNEQIQCNGMKKAA